MDKVILTGGDLGGTVVEVADVGGAWAVGEERPFDAAGRALIYRRVTADADPETTDQAVSVQEG